MGQDCKHEAQMDECFYTFVRKEEFPNDAVYPPSLGNSSLAMSAATSTASAAWWDDSRAAISETATLTSPITGDTRAFTIVVSRVPGVPGGGDDRPIGPGHSGSSSGGCNVASGLLAMILILPLFFVKKKKQK